MPTGRSMWRSVILGEGAAMPNLCPHCNIRLDVPRSIKANATAIVTHSLSFPDGLDGKGKLVNEEVFITKRGTFRCTQCGTRLNKFIKEVKVGVI